MTSKYTLFIDESGDFETHIGDWVVAGVLCPGDLDQVRPALDKSCTPLCEEFSMPQHAFHGSVLRKNRASGTGVEHTLSQFRQLLQRVLVTFDNAYFLASVNVVRRRMGNHAERTRRQMIVDILALAATMLPTGAVISQLDVVDSRRRNAAKEVITDVGNLKEHFGLALADAIEVGLASRGIMDALVEDKIRITIEEGNDCWGLIAADFVANLVFHAREPFDSGLIEELERSGSLAIFHSFGGLAERRARISERDGDFITALCRWSLIEPKPAKVALERREAVNRLCRRIISDSGSRGPRNALETVIDTIHRQREADMSLSHQDDALAIVEAGLEAATYDQPSRFLPLLFRIRNYRLLTLNHLGDVRRAEEVRTRQDNAAKHLAVNPECYHDVLQYTNLRSEVSVNNMDFGQALLVSTEYLKMVSHYEAFWELLVDGREDYNARSLFKSSRLSVSATSAHIRLLVLASVGGEDPLLAEAIRMSDELRLHIEQSRDISRWQNYRVMTLIKMRRYEQALTTAYEALPAESETAAPSDDFTLFWAARAASDWALAYRGLYSEKVSRIHKRLTRVGFPKTVRSPQDLILREVGVLEWLNGDLGEAKRRFSESRKGQSNEFSAASPINLWLDALLSLHANQATDVQLNAREFMLSYLEEHDRERLIPTTFIATLKALKSSSFNGSMLLALRSVSPY